jgi:hypothetical protein
MGVRIWGDPWRREVHRRHDSSDGGSLRLKPLENHAVIHFIGDADEVYTIATREARILRDRTLFPEESELDASKTTCGFEVVTRESNALSRNAFEVEEELSGCSLTPDFGLGVSAELDEDFTD